MLLVQLKSKINTVGISSKITFIGNPKKLLITKSFSSYGLILILSFSHSYLQALTIDRPINNWEKYSVYYTDNGRILMIWAIILHRDVDITFIKGTLQLELRIRVDPIQYVLLFFPSFLFSIYFLFSFFLLTNYFSYYLVLRLLPR